MEPEVKKPESTLLRVLSFTAEQTLRLADANTVLGDRFELDGITVIPVSKVSAGFAGGGADVNDVGRKKRQNPAGAGAKITRTPMSFLVVKDGQVRRQTIVEATQAYVRAARPHIVDRVGKVFQNFGFRFVHFPSLRQKNKDL